MIDGSVQLSATIQDSDQGSTDLALSEMGFEPQHEISQEEFEEAWNEALKPGC